jgi:O-antigen ligase
MILIKKTIDTIMLVWFLAIIVMARHRSVFLAGVAGLMLLFILYTNKVIILLKILIASIVILAVLVIVTMSSPRFEAIITKALSGITNPHKDRNASWRMQFWQELLDRLERKNLWLFGEGLGGYYQWHKNENASAPHNGYVQMVSKFGLFGLGVYALLVGKFFLATLMARSKLSPGPRRAYVEMGIINFGAAHAYLTGYSIEMSMLIFVALAMIAVQLHEVSWRVPRTV